MSYLLNETFSIVSWTFPFIALCLLVILVLPRISYLTTCQWHFHLRRSNLLSVISLPLFPCQFSITKFSTEPSVSIAFFLRICYIAFIVPAKDYLKSNSFILSFSLFEKSIDIICPFLFLVGKSFSLSRSNFIIIKKKKKTNDVVL